MTTQPTGKSKAGTTTNIINSSDTLNINSPNLINFYIYIIVYTRDTLGHSQRIFYIFTKVFLIDVNPYYQRTYDIGAGAKST